MPNRRRIRNPQMRPLSGISHAVTAISLKEMVPFLCAVDKTPPAASEIRTFALCVPTKQLKPLRRPKTRFERPPQAGDNNAFDVIAQKILLFLPGLLRPIPVKNLIWF